MFGWFKKKEPELGMKSPPVEVNPPAGERKTRNDARIAELQAYIPTIKDEAKRAPYEKELRRRLAMRGD